MTNSDLQGFARMNVYHPTRAIRVISPAEEATARKAVGVVTVEPSRSRPAMPTARERITRVLRNFARVWVNAQVHRAGL